MNGQATSLSACKFILGSIVAYSSFSLYNSENNTIVLLLPVVGIGCPKRVDKCLKFKFNLNFGQKYFDNNNDSQIDRYCKFFNKS